MDYERICLNCGSFFQDPDDMNLGVCLNDEAFEPFLDEILDHEDFSSCYEIYLQKRENGEKEACEQFNEPEIIEVPDGMDIMEYLRIEQMKYQNVDEIIKYLYDADNRVVRKAISVISRYVYMGNESAYKVLLKYYMGLGPAETLEDVYTRKEVVEILSSRKSEESTIKAYVNELARTPSNNTTRQLYTEILCQLSRCPHEMIQEPLLELLRITNYSYRIRNRIMEVAGFR